MHLEDCPISARVAPSCHVEGGGLATKGRRAPQKPLSWRLERARKIRGNERRLGSWRTRHFNSVFGSSPTPRVVLVLLVFRYTRVPIGGAGVNARGSRAMANMTQSIRQPMATTAGIFRPPFRTSIA
jgi:hypothetical protein